MTFVDPQGRLACCLGKDLLDRGRALLGCGELRVQAAQARAIVTGG
jgi:hypothetical protein